MKSGALVIVSTGWTAEATKRFGLQRRHLHHLRSQIHAHSLQPVGGLELAGGLELGLPECRCIGFNGVAGSTNVTVQSGGKDVYVAYPADLGSRCSAWDFGRHPFCQGAQPSGEFCSESWCYVDPKHCNIPVLPKRSVYVPEATFQAMPVYYSYATCGTIDKYAEQKVSVGMAGCRCIGFEGSPGMTVAMINDEKVEYPAEIGGKCEAWDQGHHPDCTGDENEPDWCGKKWCFVDPCSCTGVVSPKISKYLGDGQFQAKPVFWSYATCGETDTFSDAGAADRAKNQIQTLCNVDKTNDPKIYGKQECPCIGFDAIDGETVASVTVDGTVLEVSYPADLGGTCDVWDADSHPSCKGESAPAWCRSTWCYVDPKDCSLPVLPKLSSYQPDARFQTIPLYFSYSTCGSKDTWSTTALDLGKQGCRCIGIDGVPGSIPVNVGKEQVLYPAEMGSQCKTWDDDRHPACSGEEKADWCQKKWCYVDPCSCDIGIPPKVATFLGDASFQGKKVFWSYATCGSVDTFSTAEQQKNAASDVKDICTPVARATVYSKPNTTEAPKSNANQLSCMLTVAAIFFSFYN